MSGNFLIWAALLVFVIKLQKQIKQNIIYENCFGSFTDKNLTNIKANNIDLFQNITMCIDEKKKYFKIQKAAKPYELEDIILWGIILFRCIDIVFWYNI